MQEETRTEIRREELVEGKLTKVVYKEGEGDLPKKGQEVSALYRGTLENGSEFDSNQDRDSPFNFTVGQGQVIKGWDEGFLSMKRGEQARLICAPDYAYGARGSPPKIPPNSTLHFDVELIDFHDKKKEKWDMDASEKIEIATKLKQEGNDLLKEGKFSEASKKYTEGIDYVDAEDDEGAKAILKVLQMNASQAYIKTKQFSKAIELCNKVLKNDANNVKTLYRRAVAYTGNQDYEKAKVKYSLFRKTQIRSSKSTLITRKPRMSLPRSPNCRRQLKPRRRNFSEACSPKAASMTTRSQRRRRRKRLRKKRRKKTMMMICPI